ncbi:hypothetical protein B9Z55_003826 [Caenorhabditis nigoni]|uniref:CUB domain-containing protein n=1 Tax=Caenorhabditis nigoni TaxID=1611254 RepID=A0A2G5VSK8_9PELO|nr:hypothetical protein B9Z55_003826 [Caenorhabditis nigoni]
MILLIVILHFIIIIECSYCPIKHIHSSTPTTGFIESPGYPSAYSAPLDCVFNITTAASNVIQLSFVTFDLASKNQLSDQCLDSYLLVVVVDRHGRQHVGDRLCGNTVPSSINTMQSWMQVQFVTTAANNKHRGFRIQYRILSEAAIQEPLSTLGEPMFSGCGGHSTPGQLSGEILSPGYPSTYPKNSTCNWLIRVEARQRIYIRIVHLHLAPTIAECERASLTIIDGYKHENFGNERKESTSETSEAKFCGSQLYYSEEGMKSYLSSANRIVVRLVTQEGPASSMIGEERIGFKIVWTAVEGLIGENGIDEGGNGGEQACKDQFVCHGGQVCVEQGHGICASRSRLCIHSSLVCDGIHNCVEGDFSDEQHCYSREIITSAALGFSLIVLTMLILVCCDQFRKRRRLRALIRERRATENGKCNNNNNNGRNNNNMSNNNTRIQPNR